MLIYAAQFPVSNNAKVHDLWDLSAKWICGSPYTEFSQTDFAYQPDVTEHSATSENQHVQLCAAHANDYSCVGCQYDKHEGGLRWSTRLVGTQDSSHFWCTLRVFCDSSVSGTRLPRARKPYIVRQVLQEFGGGYDGSFEVSDTPHVLEEKDLSTVSDIILGEASCLMPVVYVSARNDNSYSLDYCTLAQWLGGMAHVLVEPDRGFSFLLQDVSDSRNVFGGAVAIYWPEGTGQATFLPWGKYSDPTDMQRSIEGVVRKALVAQRPIEQCTWEHLQAVRSRQTIEQLRRSGSTAVDKYAEAFDREIEAKDEELQAARSEINRLKSMLQKRQSVGGGVGQGILRRGKEKEYYAGEIADLLVDIIQKALDESPSSTRRQHILKDVLEENGRHGLRDKLEEDIKNLFSNGITMGKEQKGIMESWGFSIDESGKHFKVVFNGDTRYTFSIPKSTSDHRAGKNLASDMRRRLL